MKAGIIDKLLAAVASVMLFACIGCATAGDSVTLQEANRPDLVWPHPPDKPRIRFVQVVSTPEDVGIRPSALAQLFGLFVGSKEDYLSLPQQIALGRNGRLCVTDQKKNCVHIFDLARKSYLVLKDFNGKPIFSPAGVATGDDGRIYVSDSIARHVMVFDSRGKPLFTFGNGETLERPTGIVFVPENGKLYITDTLAQNLKVFDKDGTLEFQFGKRGEEEGTFNYPTHVAYDGDGRIYVTDALNHRIQVFDLDGTFRRAFGKAGDSYGTFSKPKGVAIDSRGNVYVADALHDVVQIFNRQGQLLLSFCGPGSGPGELWLPSGIAIDAEDRIYVADTYNQRIQIFELLPEAELR